jgi:hypothetical protein
MATENSDGKRIPRETLHQQLDVCRPGSNDLGAAEMAGLRQELEQDSVLRARAQQMQLLDSVITEAIHDVPVPKHLAERLLTRLQAALPATHTVPAPQIPIPRNRRTWLIGSTSLVAACAAAIVAALFLWPSSTNELGPEVVMQAARSLFQQQRGEQGVLMQAEEPPARFPLGNYVVASLKTRWRPLERSFLGRAGVAYDLDSPQGVRATLLVVNLEGAMTSPKLATPPRTPMQNVQHTDGCTTATWTDGQRLYVLVVQGDESAFRSFVREPASLA